MKRFISVLLLLSLLISIVSVLSSCNDDGTTPHEHTYSEDWSFSTDTHWIDTTCEHNLKKDESAHTFGDPVFTDDNTTAVYTCKVCGYMKSETHAHDFGEWTVEKTATIFEKGKENRACKYVDCPATESRDIAKIEISSILIAEYPTKLVYKAGETFDSTGILVKAVGADGSHTDITELVSYDKTVLADTDTTVTVSYENKTQAITITVQSLSVHTHEYPADWTVLTPATMVSAGQKYKNCTFEECQEKQIEVIPMVEVDHIAIITNPSKLNYLSGEQFNPAGLVVMAYGVDNSELDVSALITFDKDVVTDADTVVTVTFNGKSADIAISVVKKLSVSEAILPENYDKLVIVEGIYVGISDEGAGDDKEMLIKDTKTDALVSVRNVSYGAFPDYGYKYGDLIRIYANVIRINYDAANDSNQNKTYLNFSENNSVNITDTIIARGTQVEYNLENITTITSWKEMKSFFKGSLEMYTYVHFKGTMWFNSYSGSDKVLIHRLTMNPNATAISTIKPDGKRAVGIRHNMLQSNVPASLSMYFDTAFGVMNDTDKDYPGEGAKSVDLDFYAVVTCANSVNYQITILDPSWLLGRSEEVATGQKDNYSIVKEVAMAYHRQNTQISYCDKWRNENVSPETATSQRGISLDCSSFVNAVYYEAFGENVLGVPITTIEPKTESYNNYAKNKVGTSSDVVGYWETADYTDEEEQKKLLASIYASLQVGDVLVYRRASTGHTMIYMGDGQFLHSTGGISYSSNVKSDPTKGVAKASTNEYNYGTVLKLKASSLFESTTSSYYLFKSTNVSFAVLRPLARGLTPTQKTLNRMDIAGISMEKTVSAGLDKTVMPGSLISYSLTLENYSTTSYEDILFEDTLDSNVSFVSGTEGITLNGNKVSMAVDVPAMSTRVVTWTVKVSETAAVGTKIISDKTYFGGVEIFTTTNYVTEFTKDNLKAVADKAREYADGTTVYTDPTEFANKIYADALGLDLKLGTSKAVMTEVFVSLTVTATGTVKTNHAYQDIMVPTLYSGIEIKATQKFIDIHTIKEFMLGDIILCRFYNADTYRMFIYVGDDQFVQIDTTTGIAKLVDNGNENYTFNKNADTRFSTKALTVQFRSYGKCIVLRPSMGMEID